MKLYPIIILLTTSGCFSPAFADDEQTSILKEPAPEIITTARILGEIPDGTPPPPEPPKPKFIVPAKDILETKVHEQGGRQIIVRKISPIALPPPPLVAPPLDINDPTVQERIAEARDENPADEFLCA
jgi:hypothetical protein